MNLNMLEFYDNVLRALNHDVSEEGHVSIINSDDVKLPATVDNKRLVLPVPDRLKEVKENEIVFHPLREDLTRGPSEVLEYLRRICNIEASTSIESLVLTLLFLASNTELQKTLSPDQAQVLDVAKKADKETYNRFAKIIERCDPSDLERSVVRIFLKRSGKNTETNEAFRWLATVSFPLYEALIEKPTDVFGVKLRKIDHESIREVFEYLLPNIDKAHAYSYGSNSTQAPKLDALLGAYKNLITQTNSIIDLMEGSELFKDITLPNVEWMDYVGNLEVFKRETLLIPMQAGNEGAIDRSPDNQGATANLGLEKQPVAEPVKEPIRNEPRRYPTITEPPRYAPVSPSYRREEPARQAASDTSASSVIGRAKERMRLETESAYGYGHIQQGGVQYGGHPGHGYHRPHPGGRFNPPPRGGYGYGF